MSKLLTPDHASTATPQLNRRQLITAAVTLAGGLALARHAPAANAAENVAGRLQALGIQLPEPPAPVANYVAYLVQDNFAYIAGQIPFANGELLFPGSVPNEVSVDAARIAALAELYPDRSESDILNDMIGAALDDLVRQSPLKDKLEGKDK